MIYPIVAYGDPVLKKRASDIDKNDSAIDLPQLIADMFDTMEVAGGVGLAAPQIGLSLRLFVVDAEKMEEELKGFRKVFINPQMLEELGEKWAFEEGCLSIPNIREDVLRQPKLKIRYWDENWNEHTQEFQGIPARIIQHEYDHIEGVLFTDHISPLKKRLLKNKLLNISKGNVKVDYKMKFPLKK